MIQILNKKLVLLKHIIVNHILAMLVIVPTSLLRKYISTTMQNLAEGTWVNTRNCIEYDLDFSGKSYGKRSISGSRNVDIVWHIMSGTIGGRNFTSYGR